MTLTPNDLALLRSPLPLEAGHEVRQAEAKMKKDGTWYARWLVYTTEEPIVDRLNEVDAAWSLRWVNTTLTDTTANVTQELTLKGITRSGVGNNDLMKGSRANTDAVKGAATDALKRAARLFGVGAYLLNAPKIITDWAKEPTWNEREEWERQAFAQFARWYNQQFPYSVFTDYRAFQVDMWAAGACEAFVAAGLATNQFEASKRLRKVYGLEHNAPIGEVEAAQSIEQHTIAALAKLFNARKAMREEEG